MKTRTYMLIVALLFTSSAAFADRPPNIVLLIGDDHGYPYFGFMGDTNVETPSMDALARGGVTFSHGHVTVPYCRPSLRTMITGLYPVQYQLRLNEYVEKRMREDAGYEALGDVEKRMWMSVEKANGMAIFDTLPKLLKEQGYVSWQGGKWWENSYRNGHFDEGMTEGWDMDTFGTDQFFHEMMGAEGNELVRETMDPLFDFIDRHTDEPMFIWFGPMLPHTPLDAPYKYQKYYADRELSRSAKEYYANISWWDDGVGRLMDHIESRGLLENTLFIYLSDNGWEQDADVEYWYPEALADYDSEYLTGGFRGKGSLFDMGLRTPIIFYWKGSIDAEFNDTSLVSSLDLVPTILDIAGVDAPPELQGYSLRPLLDGSGSIDERSEIVSYSNNRRSRTDAMGAAAEGYAVRTRSHHFFWYADTGETRLYDMTLDPRGDVDLSESKPELVNEFKQIIAGWKESVGMTERLDIHE
ncbi:MAG: sulfatase-like hydrolase/transferase [Woeseiaceae bacterium]|nr:sulfatase-like hydrolase/transferase [Woeseiaceae bacterium]